jgi:hypothetical protein
MTRAEFIDQLQKPLLKELETRKLFTFAPPPIRPPAKRRRRRHGA